MLFAMPGDPAARRQGPPLPTCLLTLLRRRRNARLLSGRSCLARSPRATTPACRYLDQQCLAAAGEAIAETRPDESVRLILVRPRRPMVADNLNPAGLVPAMSGCAVSGVDHHIFLASGVFARRVWPLGLRGREWHGLHNSRVRRCRVGPAGVARPRRSAGRFSGRR